MQCTRVPEVDPQEYVSPRICKYNDVTFEFDVHTRIAKIRGNAQVVGGVLSLLLFVILTP